MKASYLMGSAADQNAEMYMKITFNKFDTKADNN
jgi:hypothetical protein